MRPTRSHGASSGTSTACMPRSASCPARPAAGTGSGSASSPGGRSGHGARLLPGEGARPGAPGLRRPPGPGLPQVDGQDARAGTGPTGRRSSARPCSAAGVDVPEAQRLAADVLRADGRPRYEWQVFDPLQSSAPIYRQVLTRVDRGATPVEEAVRRAKARASPANGPPRPPDSQPVSSGVVPSGVSGANHEVTRSALDGRDARTNHRPSGGRGPWNRSRLFNLGAAEEPADGTAVVRPNVWLMTSEEVPPLLFTVEQVAPRCLGIGRHGVYDLIRQGGIRSVKVGASRRVSARALSEYVSTLELG